MYNHTEGKKRIIAVVYTLLLLKHLANRKKGVKIAFKY